MRRSSAALAAGLLLLALPPPAAAQSLELEVSTRGGVTLADLSYACARPDELAGSLRAGLESRVTFIIRLYEARGGTVRLFGDHLVMERRFSRSAYWDFLDEHFVVEEDGTRTAYATSEEMLGGFFSLRGVAVSTVPRPAGHRMYVTARAQFEPVRLMPPLTLVVLAGAAPASTTPWIRREAP